MKTIVGQTECSIGNLGSDATLTVLSDAPARDGQTMLEVMLQISSKFKRHVVQQSMLQSMRARIAQDGTLVHSTGLAVESHAGENIFQVVPEAGSAS